MPSDGKSSHCLWQGELKKCNSISDILSRPYKNNVNNDAPVILFH